MPRFLLGLQSFAITTWKINIIKIKFIFLHLLFHWFLFAFLARFVKIKIIKIQSIFILFDLLYLLADIRNVIQIDNLFFRLFWGFLKCHDFKVRIRIMRLLLLLLLLLNSLGAWIKIHIIKVKSKITRFLFLLWLTFFFPLLFGLNLLRLLAKIQIQIQIFILIRLINFLWLLFFNLCGKNFRFWFIYFLHFPWL